MEADHVCGSLCGESHVPGEMCLHRLAKSERFFSSSLLNSSGFVLCLCSALKYKDTFLCGHSSGILSKKKKIEWKSNCSSTSPN